MRLLYLDWPHLHFRLAAEQLQAAAEAVPELVVVGGQPWEPGFVVDCSPPANRLKRLIRTVSGRLSLNMMK